MFDREPVLSTGQCSTMHGSGSEVRESKAQSCFAQSNIGSIFCSSWLSNYPRDSKRDLKHNQLQKIGGKTKT